MNDTAETSPDKQPAKREPKKRTSEDPFLRPPNEDDDGYDPYSDRPVHDDMWEEDPWK